jgi:long-chain fatty acid transport protein
VEEFPDNGSEQEGRGGAWVARASDPLAAFYNPAGLAGQPTRITIQANFSSQHTCFTRVKAAGDPTADGVTGTYPQVCSGAGFYPDPQVGFTWRLSDRIGVGFLLLAPSAVGSTRWPAFVGDSPAPQRYLLIQSNVVFLTPTIAAGWEIVDGLRIGASFQFGTAPHIDFVNAAVGLNSSAGTQYVPSTNDIRTELTAKDLFVPGFTVGTLWSPADDVDVAGWYKWSAPVSAKGDLLTEYPYFTPASARGNTAGITKGDTSVPNCNDPQGPPNACGSGNNASVKVPVPMEAKIGVRFHLPASRPADPHRRDPLADDLFDVEADFTWANDSAFDTLQVRFPGNAYGDGRLPANPEIPSTIPEIADVRHRNRDVFGARLGGDYNIVPDTLALRAGGFFESQAADTVYQNIDFDSAERFGVAAGATYRLKVNDTQAFDFMAAYGHVFFGTLGNTNPDGPGLPATSGTACSPSAPAGSPPSMTCPNGNQKYRTNYPVNLGTITSSVNVINVGVSFRF